MSAAAVQFKVKTLKQPIWSRAKGEGPVRYLELKLGKHILLLQHLITSLCGAVYNSQ